MGCNSQNNFDGGVWNQPTIVDSDTIRGRTTNQTHVMPTLEGRVTMDEDAAASVAKALCPHISNCVPEVSPEIVAGTFTDCEGNPHRPGDAVPTCAQMNTAIAEAFGHQAATEYPSTTEAASLPTTLVGSKREQILGEPDAYIKIGDYLVPAYFTKGRKNGASN